MSEKKHHGGPAPVPPDNRPVGGPSGSAPFAESGETGGPGDQPHDEKHRLGDFTGKGEHARVQPSKLNDGGTGNSRGEGG